VTYHWTVRVWDAQRQPLPPAATQTFRLNVQPMPHHLPTIRTFINFAGNAQFARDWLDLSFRKEAKELRDGVLATQYGLICTLVVPHPTTGRPLDGKAAALADYCVSTGLTKEGILEEMFCHFAADTKVTLHVGAERAANPRETRLCPGWDPANDRNGDGRIDDGEAADLANPKATAREPRQARIPIYFWGPPRDDFVINIGHPAYQEFMSAVWAERLCEGYDGIYFDTVPTDVAGAGRGAAVLEYPRRGEDQTLAYIRRLRQDGVFPDCFTIQSWYKLPAEHLPEEGGYSFMHTARDAIRLIREFYPESDGGSGRK